MSVLFATLLLAGTAAPAPAPMFVYSVKKGESLYVLAERYFERTGDFALVRRINRITDPHHIPVGTRIRIPLSALRQSAVAARIDAYSGPVRVGGSGRMIGAVAGMMVNEGDAIETGPHAHITLRLADGSLVSIPSQSAVRIDRMRQTALTGSVDRLFEVTSGEVRAKVTPMKDGQSRFRISTPTAVAAVRGTVFRTGYDPASRTATTAVLEGKVAVTDADAGKALEVTAGFGAAADAAVPVPLLAAPSLVAPGRLQNDERLSFTVQPVPEATGYAVEIARDAGFIDVIDDARSDVPTTSFASLPTGTYFVRAAAIDRHGLEGLPSTYGFERRLNSISAAVDRSGSGRQRQYLFRWSALGEGARQYRFQLSASPDGSAPIIDRIGLTTDRLIVTDLPAGDYYWRVMSVQFAEGRASGAWAATEQLHIATRD
jgi:hypothetical protein